MIVKTGTAAIYAGDDPTCTPQVFEAGSAFFDRGGGHPAPGAERNSVKLETVAFQIVPAAAARRIDAPSPGVCGFYWSLAEGRHGADRTWQSVPSQ